MRNLCVIAFIPILILALGCAGTQRMDRQVQVEPVHTEAAWTPPADLEMFPRVVCRYVGDAPPQIDGNFQDWPGAEWIVVDDAENYWGANWEGSEDASFGIAFAYDGDNLYVAAGTTDNVHQQSFEGSDIWKGDSFQLGLDPRLDRAKDHFVGDDVEIGWALSPDGERVVVWRWTAPKGLPTGNLDIPAAASRTERHTNFELAIPLKELGNLSPGLLDRCGISFMYNDNDGGEGDEREGALEWTPSLGKRKDPSTFGILQFFGAPEGVFHRVVAHLKPLKTITQQGDILETRLNVIAGRGAGDATLTVVFDDGEESLILTKKTIALMPGQTTYSVRVDTSNFPEGKGRLVIQFAAGEEYSVESDQPVYVYAPVDWGK
jgi:hypothetical protein